MNRKEAQPMTTACGKEEFIRDYSTAILESRAALFIGSGLSRDACAYDWKSLLRESAEDIGLNVDKEESNLISLAEYYVNSKGRSKIDEAISKCFKNVRVPAENHRLLASLPITSYWTTNYDCLLECAFENLGLSFSVITDDNSLKKHTDGNDIILRKLHGDVDRPSECIITKLDYDEFAYKHEILLSQLKGEMCAKSFLFLGYSFSDTDINHILTRIRLFYKGTPARRHFCVLQNAKKGADEEDVDFEYRKCRLEHHINDLKSYGIHTVLVDDFAEITEMLKAIRHRISAKKVFISGAFEEDKSGTCAKYAYGISKWLIENGYQIHTGYGKNVGTEIVAGAFSACEKSRTKIKDFNRSVFLYPFPYQKAMSDDERKETYTELRKNAILRTHITIIINGTKKQTKHFNPVVSDGVLEEWRLSVEQGNIVIPIAVFEGAARQMWTEMNESNSDYSHTDDFQALAAADSTFDMIMTAVKSIIKSES
jgi:hypothetical protein